MKDEREDLDILNPDIEVSTTVLNRLEKEIYEDLKDQLSELENLSEEERYIKPIDKSIIINHLENLNIVVQEDFKNILTTIQSTANYIRYSLQQNLLSDMLKEYLSKNIPELDLTDPCKFMLKKNFSNTFLLFKKDSEEKIRLDSIEIKYLYEYDSQSFQFKIVSSNNSSFSITLKQLRLLLGLDNTNTIDLDNKMRGSEITILLPDGKKIII